MEVQKKVADDESQSITDVEEYFREANNVSVEDEINELLFSNNRIVGFYENEESIEELPSFTEFTIEEIEDYLKDYFKFFSLEERDFIYLHLIDGKSQTELSEIFDKTQPALCCDAARIRDEIAVIRMMKQTRPEVIEFLSQNNGLNYLERNVLLAFFYSVSITKTAYIMKINSMLCRSRIESSVKKLKRLGHDKIFDYFSYILRHLNKIKSTKVDRELMELTPRKRDYTSGYTSVSLF